MNVIFTAQEAKEAKQKGWTAEHLRICLFTDATFQLSEFMARQNAIFTAGINYNTRIFPPDIVRESITERNITILKHNDIITVCGSGYMINKSALPENMRELYNIAEKLIWEAV